MVGHTDTKKNGVSYLDVHPTWIQRSVVTLLASGQVCSVVVFFHARIMLNHVCQRLFWDPSSQLLNTKRSRHTESLNKNTSRCTWSWLVMMTPWRRCVGGDEGGIPNKMDTSIEHTWDLTYFDQQNVGFSRNWDVIGISAMKLENNWMQTPKICGLLWLSPSKSSFKKLNEGNNQQNAWHGRNRTEVPQSILPISNWCFH